MYNLHNILVLSTILCFYASCIRYAKWILSVCNLCKMHLRFAHLVYILCTSLNVVRGMQMRSGKVGCAPWKVGCTPAKRCPRHANVVWEVGCARWEISSTPAFTYMYLVGLYNLHKLECIFA